MNKRLVSVIIVLVCILAVAGFAYANRNQSTSTTATDLSQAMTPETKSESTETPAMAQAPGAYLAYSADAVRSATGTKILFFHAPWCPQCRALDSSIKAGKVPDGTTIFKVDYDSNQALRKQYGVTIQTTLVSIDGEGKLVKKHVAYDDPSLQAVLSSLGQ
jgi:thiol-disulfide isomerase/thioredoxin